MYHMHKLNVVLILIKQSVLKNYTNTIRCKLVEEIF